MLSAAGVSAVILLIIASQLDGAAWLPFVIGGGFSTLVCVLLVSALVKLSVLAQEHACRDPAVEMSQASERQVTFRFHNPLYAQAFARSNNVRVATRRRAKPPRGTYILQGKNAVSSVIIAVVIGAIAHSVIYAMMEDTWKHRSAKAGVGGPVTSRGGGGGGGGAPSPATPRIGNADYQPTWPERQPTYGVSELSTRIANGKARAKAMETEIEQMDSELEPLSSRLRRLKSDVEWHEDQIGSGAAVNRLTYQQAVDDHNRLVNQYNLDLAARNAKYAEYSREIASVNDMVRRYNRGER